MNVQSNGFPQQIEHLSTHKHCILPSKNRSIANKNNINGKRYIHNTLYQVQSITDEFIVYLYRLLSALIIHKIMSNE